MENWFEQIPGNLKKTEKKKSTINEILKAVFVLFFVVVTTVFSFIGIIRIFKALFTDYTLQTIDLAYFAVGIGLLSLFAVFVVLDDIKKMSEATAKATLHIMRKQNSQLGNSSSSSPFSSLLNNMFGNQSVAGDPNSFSGSISVVDLNNPNNPIFKGNFNSHEELQELRNKLINKMLNSQGEFQGKKMTKQDMLNTMSIEELDTERIKAEQDEDWLWAAALRDKIKEKKGE